MEDLDKILGYVWVETTGGDAPLSEAYPELKQVLTELINKEVIKAKLEVFESMIKMQEDYENKLRSDRDRGVYPVSFGSASGALANAGWVNYFKDRIADLKATLADTESMGGETDA